MPQPNDRTRWSLAAFQTPSDYYVAEALTEAFTAEGLAVYDDDLMDQLRVYRHTPPEAVPRRTLETLVRERALALMDEIAADDALRDGPRRIARETATRVRRGIKGTTSYIRHLTDLVVDSLPELTRAEAQDIRAAIAAAKPRKAPAPPKSRAAYMANRRAAQKDAANKRAAEVLDKWLIKFVQPGEYDAGDLWERWNAEIMPRATVKAPELHRVGRNAWYALLEAAPTATVRVSHNRRVVSVH